MVRQVVATPSREALECARLLRLDKTEAIYWALQFDSVAKSSIALSGRSQRIHAWLVYPVVFGSTPERMQILPGVSARVWLVTPEGYSLFFSVSRPVLSVDKLDELVRFLHRLSADLGHQSQHCRLETQIKRVTGIALSIKSVEWNVAELGCLRLGEYLTQQLFGRLSVLPAVRRQIVKLLHNRLLQRLETEIRAMPQHLDAAVCHCLPTSDQAFDLSCYNRILGLAPADDAYRRQAFQVLPVLARLADDATRAALSAGRHARREPDSVQIGIAMLQAIDCGDPLFQTLKQLFQLPEEVFRWASRHAELINGWPFDISILFRVLGAMAPELRPATDEQWL